MLSLYPSLQADFDTLYNQSLATVREGPQKDHGVAWGSLVATSILQWRNSDGSGKIVTYTPGTQPGEWRPTLSFGGIVRPALLPQWGSVTPFALGSGSQFRPPAPPALNTQQYAAEVNMVKAVGGTISAVRTAEQMQIALFWGYGPSTATPPGHWNQIAQAVAASQGNTVEENARLFALLNIALADAAIVSWDCKYVYNYWRPITAIQEADTDGNPETTADPVGHRSWLRLPFQNTPQDTAHSAAPQPRFWLISLAQTMCLSPWAQMTCPVSTAVTSSFRKLPRKAA